VRPSKITTGKRAVHVVQVVEGLPSKHESKKVTEMVPKINWKVHYCGQNTLLGSLCIQATVLVTVAVEADAIFLTLWSLCSKRSFYFPL
jgi:hypothetical protein